MPVATTSGEIRLEWTDGSGVVISNTPRVRITGSGAGVTIGLAEVDYGDGYGPTMTITLNLNSPLPLSQGGTNGITATSAFHNLSPLTTKGDIIVMNQAGSNVRFPVGTDGQVLTADSSQLTGLRWGP